MRTISVVFKLGCF